MRKLGIYGGTFSPPHLGHFKSALAFYDSCQLDELLIMPAGIPPHKQILESIPSECRFEMAKLLFSPERCGRRNISVCNFELKKEGKSYTYETLMHFSSPENQKIFLLVGSDMFLSLHEWRHPEIISKLATIVLNRRETSENDEAFNKEKEMLEKSLGTEILCPVYIPFPISSSDIKKMIAEGRDVSAYLSCEVANYIKQKDLYATYKALYKIMQALPNYISEKRLQHVCSVEKEMRELLRLYGFQKNRQEETELRKAALLHDITHEKTTEEQLLLAAHYNFRLTKEDLASPAVLHQFTGSLVAADVFKLSEKAVAAIACHTTGKENMTTAEKLLCLADYIEETRAYKDCKELRESFHCKITPENKYRLLDECILKYLENNVRHLQSKDKTIHPLTLKAYEFYKNQLVNYRIL